MVWDKNGRVYLLSCYWVESADHAKVLLYHFFLVSVSALNNDWLIHQLIAYCTFEKVRHVKRLVIFVLVEILFKVGINSQRVLHRGSLLWLICMLQVSVCFKLFLEIDHQGCFLVSLQFVLLVPPNFLGL